MLALLSPGVFCRAIKTDARETRYLPMKQKTLLTSWPFIWPIRISFALAAISALTAFGQTITNPSFEADTFTVAPGFISDNAAITGWTASSDAGAGLNPAGGSTEHADNGAVPDGKNVAFITADGTTLSTIISGLTVGTVYHVTFRANSNTNPAPNDPNPNSPNAKVSIDGVEVLPVTVYPVTGTNAYTYLAFEFTAGAASQTLSILNDAATYNTLLIDDFKIVPSNGKWSVQAWTGDSDSGFDSQYVYTHAYSFGSAVNGAINGIPFTGVAGTSPAVANKFSTTFLANLFAADDNAITALGGTGSAVLARDFVYGGNVPAGSYQSIAMEGLTPGTEYVVTLYSVAFDPPGPGIRWATFSLGDDRLTVNQDQFDNNNGISISYHYTADATGKATLKFIPINLGNVSIHVYGFSNREAVSRNVLPAIASQPQSTTVSQGLPVTFNVLATGFPAPTYAWRFNGTAITGATTDTYNVTQATSQTAGKYDVIVANSVGSVTSIVANLTVGIHMTNPSFEVDSYLSWPGYSGDNPGDANTPAGPNVPITGWTLGTPNGAGINPISNGSSPFADNGIIPNGTNVAFLQANDAMTQTVTGLTVGAQYYVHYYENARTGAATPAVEVRLGTNTLIAAHEVTVVGAGKFYHEVYSEVFTATAASVDLAFVKSAPAGGDTTALIDNVAIVQVPAGTAPFITSNPASVAASVGDSVTFKGQGIGSLPLAYQWSKNGTDIAGATNATLTLSNLQKPDEADYAFRVSNSTGQATSTTAHLTVNEPIPDLYNTGVDNGRIALADNAVDPHYTLIDNPDTGSPDALVEDSTVFPISDGTWLRDTAISKWIGPKFNTADSAIGFYTYRTVINLKDRDPSTVMIIGHWSTDNNGRDIKVNGVSTGNPENAGFNVYTPFSIYGTNTSFVAGSNAIDFIVENVAAIGYTGLRVEILQSNVKIPAGVAPEITTQPLSQEVAEGSTVTLASAARGTAPLSYQWKKDGQALAGQTNLTLVLTNVTTADSGAYTMSASNAAGSATSDAANLCVCLRPIPGIYGTGVDNAGKLLADGDVDPHYTMTLSPDADFPGPDAIVVTNAWPIQVGVWLPNGPDSRWIGPSTLQGTGNAEGDYIYQTKFDLSAYDLSQVTVAGGWAVDNAGNDILVNGTSTGLKSTGFGSLTSFTLTSTNGLVKGTNTIEFLVNNAPATPNPTGLRVDLKGYVPIPQVSRPTLKVTRDGQTVSVSWAPVVAGQKLQQATSVIGPWSDVTGAANPYTVTVGTAQFFRIAQ